MFLLFNRSRWHGRQHTAALQMAPQDAISSWCRPRLQAATTG